MHLIARANFDRQVWENPLGEIDLFSTHSDVFCSTWPSSGMWVDGVAYELPTPALPTPDTGSSVLPTPAAADSTGGRISSEMGGTRESGAKRSITLATAIHHKLLKTPTSQLAINGGSQHPEKRKAGGHGPTLADEVEHLFPTPAAMNPNDGEGLESWEARRARVKLTAKNGNGFGMPLAIAVQLLGEPTRQPLNAGNPSPDE